MAERDAGVSDPVADHLTNAAMEQDVSIDATPEALRWTVSGGVTKRQEKNAVDR